MYYEIGDMSNSLKYNTEHYIVSKNLHGEKSFEVGNSYFKRGNIFSNLENYIKSIGYYKKALDIFLNSEYSNDIITCACYNNLGNIYLYLNNNEVSLSYYLEALKIAKLNFDENSVYVANIYSNLANIYNNLNNKTKSIEYSNRALKSYEVIYGSNSSQAAMELDNQGTVLLKSKDYKDALNKFLISYNYRKLLFDNKTLRISQSYLNISYSLLKLTQIDSALIYIQKALISMIQNYNNFDASSNPELIYLNNEYELPQLNKSLTFYSHSDLITILTIKATILYEKYKLTNNVEKLLDSYSTINIAIGLSDIKKNQYNLTKSTLFLQEQNKEIYNIAIKINIELINNGFLEDYSEVLILSERCKNQILLSEVLNNNPNRISGIPIELLKLENDLKNKISDLSSTINNLKQKNKKIDDSRILSSEVIQFKYVQKYDSLISKLKEQYPQYKKFKNRKSYISIKDVQKNLQNEELILQYFYHDTILYIILIGNQEFLVKEIVANNFKKNIDEFNINIKKLDEIKFSHSANYLYNILIGPIIDQISNYTRLIIIPDDQILSIPFGTLVRYFKLSNDQSEIKKIKYLIEDFEIIYNYSTELWLYPEKQPEDKQNKTSIYDFVGFAPVQFHNYCIEEILNNKKNTDSNINKLSDLPFSEEEVRQIAQIFNSNGKNSKIYLFDNATKENLLKAVKEYEIVHIATHGFIDEFSNSRPGLIFSINTNYANIKQSDSSDTISINNDILYSDELSNIAFSADLITLSSCESGQGFVIEGEGIINMTRELIYSGANNIITSLWQISDKYTKDLMVNFYAHFNEGINYSKALRNAKLSMLKNGESKNPIYWGGFILVGK